MVNITNLTKVYDDIIAINNLNISFHQDNIISILGANGAGKTTLMRCISGMLQATDGQCYINGQLLSYNSTQHQISICSQQNIFFNHMTVQQHLQFFQLLKQKPNMCAKKMKMKLMNY